MHKSMDSSHLRLTGWKQHGQLQQLTRLRRVVRGSGEEGSTVELTVLA